MDRILFGGNQFFAVNHLSDEKARAQAMQFRSNEAIIDILDFVYDLGIRTFTCTTHDRISDICDHIRAQPHRYAGFKIYPCMPYAHKYANAVTEYGPIGAVQRFLPGNIVSTSAKGGLAMATRDYRAMMELLIDAEMKMFEGINTPVVFLQNVVTDLLLGLGLYDYFSAFAEYVKDRYNAEPGFITMNMPQALAAFEACGIENPIVCASINKIGFRMSGGRDLYEKALAEHSFRPVAMQVLAAGAVSPAEALEYVCSQQKIQSILFGASTKSHIRQTAELIDTLT